MRIVQMIACCCTLNFDSSVNGMEIPLVDESHDSWPGSRQRTKSSPSRCPGWMYSAAFLPAGLRLVMAFWSKAITKADADASAILLPGIVSKAARNHSTAKPALE